MTDIVIVNQSALADAAISIYLPAWQAQITEDFWPVWHAGATLYFAGTGQPVPRGMWPLFIKDRCSQAGALGDHDDNTGTPEAQVGQLDDEQYNTLLTVTVSHELLEMLGDPTCRRVVGLPGGIYQSVEVADPVEADSDGYDKLGVRVSNFVTPDWFLVPGAQKPGDFPPAIGRFDFRKLLSQPLELRPGGYRLVDQGGAWNTIAARRADGTLSARAVKNGSRSERRAAASRAAA